MTPDLNIFLDEVLNELHEKSLLLGIVNDGKPHKMPSHSNNDSCTTEAKARLTAKFEEEKREARIEAETGRILEWLEGQDVKDVAKLLGMIVYLYIMKPTNAAKFSVNMAGMTYKGEAINDIKLTTTLIPKSTKEKK